MYTHICMCIIQGAAAAAGGLAPGRVLRGRQLAAPTSTSVSL